MPRFSDILIVDGHAFSWKRLCDLRRAQLEAERKARAAQLALFEAHEDCRPATERTAALRYLEPGLLELIHR
jgi:endonuclease YncB( thermonuclease family)